MKNLRNSFEIDSGLDIGPVSETIEVVAIGLTSRTPKDIGSLLPRFALANILDICLFPQCAPARGQSSYRLRCTGFCRRNILTNFKRPLFKLLQPALRNRQVGHFRIATDEISTLQECRDS